eukprot:g2151.t1
MTANPIDLVPEVEVGEESAADQKEGFPDEVEHEALEGPADLLCSELRERQQKSIELVGSLRQLLELVNEEEVQVNTGHDNDTGVEEEEEEEEGRSSVRVTFNQGTQHEHDEENAQLNFDQQERLADESELRSCVERTFELEDEILDNQISESPDEKLY